LTPHFLSQRRVATPINRQPNHPNSVIASRVALESAVAAPAALGNTFLQNFLPGAVFIGFTGLQRLVVTVAAINADTYVDIITTIALGDRFEIATPALPAHNLSHTFTAVVEIGFS
jgi:hypothetical protein